MIYIIMFLLLHGTVFSADAKRELRAVWTASVFNIDWPSASGLTAEQQKEEMITLLDTAQDLRFNAVILQIKPTSDAFYKSKLSPWSRYLTGTQGQNPGYDPLEFFIEESQKRNLETHVWVNPFRILNGGSWDGVVSNHIARKNPDWVIEYNGRYYFDPGNPKAQSYIIKEIMEIVKNYDIDVLHMDDYFYPYKAYGADKKILHFNDDDSFKKHGRGFSDRDDWRRHNVNIFVKTLGEAIKKEKKHVAFGISPFGVWRNKSADPKGSDTLAGQTNYDDLYADVLAWINKDWIDYIMPQVYWHFDNKSAPYGVLAKWWNDNTKNNVKLYMGLGVYKLSENNWPVTYIKEQVDFARKQPRVSGFAHYSAKWIVNDTKNIQSYIKREIHPHYALAPSNLEGAPPLMARNLSLKENVLTWDNGDKKNTRYFAVYRFDKNSRPDYSKAENIIALVSAKNELSLAIPDHNDNYTYGVTALSRLHKESPLITLQEAEKQEGLDLLDILISD